jgi:hypothetical protein
MSCGCRAVLIKPRHQRAVAFCCLISNLSFEFVDLSITLTRYVISYYYYVFLLLLRRVVSLASWEMLRSRASRRCVATLGIFLGHPWPSRPRVIYIYLFILLMKENASRVLNFIYLRFAYYYFCFEWGRWSSFCIDWTFTETRMDPSARFSLVPAWTLAYKGTQQYSLIPGER